MTSINPYLTFNGNCKAAFDFYRSVFGGEFSYVGKFSDMPPNPEYKLSEADMERIMHISLPISDETVLMGSDSSEAYDKTTVVGNNFSIAIGGGDEAEATRIYNELSAGGIIKMPLEKTFWGALFGMFIDKFGIHWMVNCDLGEQKNSE